MKNSIEKYSSVIVIGSLAISALGLLWAWLALRSVGGTLIVAFGPAGIIEVGPLHQVLMVPVTGLLFAIIDFFILQKLPPTSGRRGGVALISLATSLLLFIAVFAIIRANV